MSTMKVDSIVSSGGTNTAQINGITPALASQAEAEAGTDNTKLMTPLRNLQAGVGAPHFVLEDQKASGTNAQSITQNVWNTRDLNTEVRDALGIVSLSTNAFTVTANCWVEWSAPGRDTCKTRLYNVTDGVVAAVGTTSGTGLGSRSFGGALCVAGKTYRVEQITNTTQISQLAAGQSTAEVYTRVFGWRTT